MATKTGIITDLRMLNHKCKKNHPESPQRLTKILEMMEQKKYFEHEKIQYLPSYERFANDQEIGQVYPQKYIEYIKNLWPKASHRTDITVLDTYFNEHSNKIARLSVGGVLEGIDQILTKKWKNGFTLIRPPGHHSGAKNTINGFCIFNNIAIGAKYLQKRYSVKKILILDYDIHQGDGTHHIFENDPNVLFLSVHRHDHGSYYPAGEGANYPNCGKQAAQGTKLNIPLNYLTKQQIPLPYQSPGDNQYIYLYNRIIHPIIESFDPQFILVSSGFDAARYDPVGQFTVTPNAYYYITRRLMEFNKPLLCVLQGGYNFVSSAEAATSVVQALIGQEQLPEPIENVTFKDLRHLCHLEKQYHQNLDQIIEHHSKYWKVLITQQQIQYTNLIKQNTTKSFGIVKAQSAHTNDIVQTTAFSESTTQFYFAGGHMQRFRNFSLQNQRILKWAYPEQRKFYQSDFPQKQFAPKFYGVEDEFVVIQNLLYKHQNPIIVDVKLSRQSKNPANSQKKQIKEHKKEVLSTADKYSFRICGFTTPEYKQGGMLISDEEINKKILKKVVTSENKQFFCSFLRGLAEELKKVNRHYYGSSILLVKGNERSSIKWVDFHYWYDKCPTYDQGVVQGLQNLQKFILEVDQTKQ